MDNFLIFVFKSYYLHWRSWWKKIKYVTVFSYKPALWKKHLMQMIGVASDQIFPKSFQWLRDWIVSDYINFTPAFPQSFNIMVPILPYSLSSLPVSPGKLCRNPDSRKVLWRLVSLLFWRKMVVGEACLTPGLLAAASALENTGISSQINSFRRVCIFIWRICVGTQ